MIFIRKSTYWTKRRWSVELPLIGISLLCSCLAQGHKRTWRFSRAKVGQNSVNYKACEYKRRLMGALYTHFKPDNFNQPTWRLCYLFGLFDRKKTDVTSLGNVQISYDGILTFSAKPPPPHIP